MTTDETNGGTPPTEKKKKTPKPKPLIIKERILAKFLFTPKEMSELGVDCGRLTGEINELVDQAKSAASDFKSRIESKQSARNSVATKLTNGYEMRETECVVQFFPKTLRKRYVSIKSKQVIREEEMTQSDLQMPMFRKEEILGTNGKKKKTKVVPTGDPKKDALLEAAQLQTKVEFDLSNVGPEYTMPDKLVKAWQKKAAASDWPTKILGPFLKLALEYEQDGMDAVAAFLRPFTVEP